MSIMRHMHMHCGTIQRGLYKIGHMYTIYEYRYIIHSLLSQSLHLMPPCFGTSLLISCLHTWVYWRSRSPTRVCPHCSASFSELVFLVRKRAGRSILSLQPPLTHPSETPLQKGSLRIALSLSHDRICSGGPFTCPDVICS